MKILFCGKCYGMRSFEMDDTGDGHHPWTYCDCKQMAARWENPDLGTVQVLSMVPERAFIIGMNNNFLRDAVHRSPMSNEDWQKSHAMATLAPDHVFDAHRRACWACVLQVGTTTDISWHPAQEKIKMGMTIEEALFEPCSVKVNSTAKQVDKLFLNYDDIVALAGHDPMKGVLYSITYHGKTSEGSIWPGKILKVEADMYISCVFTGNA